MRTCGSVRPGSGTVNVVDYVGARTLRVRKQCVHLALFQGIGWPRAAPNRRPDFDESRRLRTVGSAADIGGAGVVQPTVPGQRCRLGDVAVGGSGAKYEALAVSVQDATATTTLASLGMRQQQRKGGVSVSLAAHLYGRDIVQQ